MASRIWQLVGGKRMHKRMPPDEGAAKVILDAWLAARGSQLSTALDKHGEKICAVVSTRLAATFPLLCYDSARGDAEFFQQHMFQEVPRRFQRVLQAVLLFQSLAAIEQEYRWGWTILSHYGIAPLHLLAHVRWYFSALRATIPLDASDIQPLDILERNILQIIEEVTASAALPYKQHTNGHDNIKRKT